MNDTTQDLTNDTTKLTKLRVRGFRSLRDVTLELTPVTVLIGPNGSGKTNVLWMLEMVRMLTSDALQHFVNERGGAEFLLHYGPSVTPFIDIALEFVGPKGENAYEARLGYGPGMPRGYLFFHSERAGYRKSKDDTWKWVDLGSGHTETRLKGAAERGSKTAERVFWLLTKINFYHFHDTSGRSPLRTGAWKDLPGDYLRSDGCNLPAFLLSLKESTDPSSTAAWRRIGDIVRLGAPFLKEILPTADDRGVYLQWKDERGATFGPAHLSDGTLRMLALVTALAQPEKSLPLVTCIDEPELGLHPAALEVLCALIKSVAANRQVVIATQSPVVLDHFEPADVVVAERHEEATTLRRLDEAELASWLEEYSLSELYDKNVLGGRP